MIRVALLWMLLLVFAAATLFQHEPAPMLRIGSLKTVDSVIPLVEVDKGYFDDVEVKRALAFESALRSHVKSKFKDLFERIETTKDLNADDEKALAAAIEDFKKNGAY